MAFTDRFLKAFRIIVRITAIVWAICGAVFIGSAFLVDESTLLFAGIGILLLVAAAALLVAKPLTKSDLDRIRGIVP